MLAILLWAGLSAPALPSVNSTNVNVSAADEDGAVLKCRRGTPLTDVFGEIERLFGVHIIYVSEEVRGYLLTGDVVTRDAERAVGMALLEQPFAYKRQGNYFYVSARKPVVYDYRIGGRVVSAEGDTLAYAKATLLPRGRSEHSEAVVADAEGRFEVRTRGELDFVIEISHLGFAPFYVSMKNVAEDVELGIITLKETSIELGDVVVETDSKDFVADRHIFFPDYMVEGRRSSGVELLGQLGLPSSTSFITDVVLTEEEFARLNVLINGHTATLYEVRAMKSDDVVRVEYLYNYQGRGRSADGQSTAINLITRNRYGFDALAEVESAMPWSDNRAGFYIGLQTPRQSWGLQYAYEQEHNKHVRQDEDYRLYDDRGDDAVSDNAKTNNGVMKREVHSVGIGGKAKVGDDGKLDLNLGYSYEQRPDNIIERAGRQGHELTSKSEYANEVDLSLAYSWEKDSMHALTATLDAAYDDRKFRHGFVSESLTADYAGRSKEWTGRASVDYECKIEQWQGRFRLSHNGVSADFDYSDVVNHAVRMSVSAAHAGASYSSKTLLADACVGVQWVDMPRGETWMLCPSANVRYLLGGGWSLGCQFSSSAQLPQTDLMNTALLLIDNYRIRTGNKHLKPSQLWQTDLFAERETPTSSFRFGANLRYDNNPVGEMCVPSQYDGRNVWLASYVNGNRYADFSQYVSAKIQLVPKLLQMRMAYAWHRLETGSLTKSYSLFEAELLGQNGGWAYGASFCSQERMLFGEAEIRKPLSARVFTSYSWKNFSLGVQWQNPLCGDAAKSQIIMHSVCDRSERTFMEYAKWGEVKISFCWSLSLSDKSTSYK